MNLKVFIHLFKMSTLQYITLLCVFLLNTTVSASVISGIADHLTDADTTLLKSENTNTDILRITVNANNKSDELYIHFNPDATDLFDGAFDAYNLASLAGNIVPDIYAVDALGTKYSINTFPFSGIDKTVEVGFEIAADATAVLQTSGVETFNGYPDMGIYLLDTKTGNQVSLRTTCEYTFAYQASDDPRRFKIKFIGITAGIPQNKKNGSVCRVFAANRELNLQYNELAGKHGCANILDLQGRLIETVALDGSGFQKVSLPVSTGIYLVHISFPGVAETHKVAVR